LALAFSLAKELSGEAHVERAQNLVAACRCAETEDGAISDHLHNHSRKTDAQVYVETTERRFRGVNRCC
jgi:hypothetical protein